MMKFKKIIKFMLMMLFLTLLMNTESYAATIGEHFPTQEEGWKRYDDSDNKIVYTGNVIHEPDGAYYNGSNSYFTSTDGTSIKFKANTSKIRIVSTISTNWNDKNYILIDGVKYDFNCYSDTNVVRGALVFEKLDLSPGVHTFELGTDPSRYSLWGLDAIDIDSTGYLLDMTSIDYILKVVLEVSEQLQLSVDEDLTENTNMTWISSNPDIATVDANGVVTAIKEGNAVITVRSADGSYTEDIKVLVVDDAKNYRLAVDLKVGQKCRLTIDDAEDLIGAWSVMDPTIATITNNGRVTAISKGLTIVTATDDNGNEVGQIYIRVRD